MSNVLIMNDASHPKQKTQRFGCPLASTGGEIVFRA